MRKRKISNALTGEMVKDLRKRVGAANVDASDFLSDIIVQVEEECMRVCKGMPEDREKRKVKGDVDSISATIKELCKPIVDDLELTFSAFTKYFADLVAGTWPDPEALAALLATLAPASLVQPALLKISDVLSALVPQEESADMVKRRKAVKDMATAANYIFAFSQDGKLNPVRGRMPARRCSVCAQARRCFDRGKWR